MIVRKTIKLLLLSILLAWFGGIGSVWAVDQSGENNYVKYLTSSQGFNIQFKYKGSWQKTTFNDGGYKTVVKVGNDEASICSSGFQFGTEYTALNIGVTIVASINSARPWSVNIKYIIKNKSGSPLTFKIGSWADTQVGSDDSANIEREGNNTIMMTSSSGAMYGITAGTDPFSTLWYGYYGSASSNVFNDNQGQYQGTSTDSGLAWSWTIENLAAGATKEIEFGGLAPSVRMSSYTYGGTLSTPSISIEGDPSFTYYFNTTGNNSGGNPWSNVTSSTYLNAGSYFIYAHVEPGGSDPAYNTPTTPFTVSKATPQASDFTFIPPSNLVYNGTQKTATLTSGKTGMGTITVKYYSGSTLLSSAPKDVGTYTVKIDVAEGTNYVAATNLTNSWMFTIAKAPPQASDFTFTPPSNLVYNGTLKTATVTTNLSGGKTGMGNITAVRYFKGTTELGYAPTDAGTYTVKIDVAAGTNYTAATGITAATWTFTITPKPLTSNDIIVTIATATYSGEEQMPVVIVMDGTKVLVKNTDFEVSKKGAELKNAQTYVDEIIIKGIGNYSGTLSGDFTINPKDISLCTVTGNSISYTGNVINPLADLVVKDGNTTLNTTDHYTISVSGDYTYKDPGTYANAITITGKGNYTGTKYVNFIIAAGGAIDLSTALITSSAVYTGASLPPSSQTVTVKIGETTLTSGFTISYNGNASDYVDAKTYINAIVITGNGNSYYGTATANYIILPRSVSDTDITVTDVSYNRAAHDTKPQITVKYDDNTIPGSNYTVTPASVTEAGVYTLTIAGVDNSSLVGSTTKTIMVTKALDGTYTDDFTITETPTQIYDGTNAIQPAVSVYDNGRLLTLGKEYTIEYGDNNTEGTAAGSITITGVDPYFNSKTFTFGIVSEYFTEDGITYHANSSTTVAVGNKGDAATTKTGAVTIPAEVTHVVVFKVTGIETGAFKNCTEITGISMPHNTTLYLESIENEAFEGCTALRYIDLCDATAFTPTSLERNITASPFFGVPKQALVYLNGTTFRGENYVYKPGDGTHYYCELFKIYDDTGGDQLGFSETNGYKWAFENRHSFTAYTLQNTRMLTAGKHYTTCLPYELDIPNSFKAYTLDAASDKIFGFREVTGRLKMKDDYPVPYLIIPSASGQLLSTTNVLVQEFKEEDGIADKLAANKVEAGSFAMYPNMRYMDKGDSFGKYIMQYNNGNPAWLQIISDGAQYTNHPNRACILPMRAYIVNTGSGSRESMGVSLTNLDGSTVLFDIDQLQIDRNELYDLQGRKLLAPQRKGVYIVNGKKVMMK